MSFTPFSDGDTHSAFRHRLETAFKEIRELGNDYLLRRSPTELETHFLGKTLIEPLTLHADLFHGDHPRSLQIDARHDRNRIFFPGDDRPFNIPGSELRIHVLYEGDKGLWKLRGYF